LRLGLRTDLRKDTKEPLSRMVQKAFARVKEDPRYRVLMHPRLRLLIDERSVDEALEQLLMEHAKALE